MTRYTMPAERIQPGTLARPEPLRNRRRWLVVVLIGIAAAALSLVIFVSREPPVIYVFDVDEAFARRARGEPLEELRITGALVPGTLVRSDRTGEVSFQMRPLRAREPILDVRATGDVMIAERDAQRSVEVSVQGRWSEAEGALHFAAEWAQVRYRYEMKEDTSVPVPVPVVVPNPP